MATFRHGEAVVMVDHTPGTAVTAGDIVVVGNTALIAHVDIAANELGALAAGRGVYSELADGAIGAGLTVYWNSGASRVTTTATSNQFLGFTTKASTGADQPLEFVHEPSGTLGT